MGKHSKEMDGRFKETGVETYMPMFIPESLLQRERPRRRFCARSSMGYPWW